MARAARAPVAADKSGKRASISFRFTDGGGAASLNATEPPIAGGPVDRSADAVSHLVCWLSNVCVVSPVGGLVVDNIIDHERGTRGGKSRDFLSWRHVVRLAFGIHVGDAFLKRVDAFAHSLPQFRQPLRSEEDEPEDENDDEFR